LKNVTAVQFMVENIFPWLLWYGRDFMSCGLFV